MYEKLNNLSRNEMKRFRDFGNSPYFNKYDTLRKLINYLYSGYPELKESDLDKEKVSYVVYSEKTVNEVKLRKLFSDLSLLYEKFILQTETEKDEFHMNISLLKKFGDENLEKQFNKQLRKVKQIESKITLKDRSFYSGKHEFHRTTALHNFNFIHSNDKENLDLFIDNLDYDIILTKLWSFINRIFADREYNSGYSREMFLYDEIIAYIEKNEKVISTGHSYIYTRYLTVKMFMTYDDKYLNMLIDYFKKNEKKFTGQLLKDYYSYVLHYLRCRLDTEIEKRKDLSMISFGVYEVLFKDFKSAESIYINGKVEDSMYQSAVSTALYCGKYKWAEKFINKFRSRLYFKYKNDAYNFALAKYYCALKEYETASAFLNKIPYKDESYRNNVKLLTAELHYRKGDFETPAHGLTNLYQALKKKDSNVKVFRDNHPLYIKYFRKLLKLKSSDNTTPPDIKLFLEEIKKEKLFFPKKTWMIEMAEELLGLVD